MNGDVRLTFAPDGRSIYLPVYSHSIYEDDEEYIWSFDDEEEDKGVLSALWDSMHWDEGKSVVTGASISPRPVDHRFMHEISREEKRKH